MITVASYHTGDIVLSKISPVQKFSDIRPSDLHDEFPDLKKFLAKQIIAVSNEKFEQGGSVTIFDTENCNDLISFICITDESLEDVLSEIESIRTRQ